MVLSWGGAVDCAFYDAMFHVLQRDHEGGLCSRWTARDRSMATGMVCLRTAADSRLTWPELANGGADWSTASSDDGQLWASRRTPVCTPGRHAPPRGVRGSGRACS